MIKHAVCVATMVTILSTSGPALASGPRDAAFASSADPVQNRTYLFSGATVRLGLDERSERRPEVALRFAGATQARGSAPSIGEGIAFTVADHSNPKLMIAGQDSKVISKRLEMSDGAKVALIAGGLVLVLGAVVLIAADKASDDINEDGGCC